MARLRGLVETMCGRGEERREGGEEKSEAVKRLEQQVLACREEIQARMAALRQRFDTPIQGRRSRAALQPESDACVMTSPSFHHGEVVARLEGQLV